MAALRDSLNRGQWLLLAATAVCYAAGYPLALVVGWPGGWVLVSLGGVLLLWLGVLTVRRASRTRTGRDPEPRLDPSGTDRSQQ